MDWYFGLPSFSVSLLFVLGKFAWKPIMNSLHDRERSIEEALQSAEQAQEQMKQLKAEQRKS
ncbi:MAG: ATP synthase F0 subunit B [Bacteroidales bacterium]|nr:ATP synthase F0 subunit B [Bacteroidales bacterium]